MEWMVATPVLGTPVFLAVGVFWGDVCHMVERPSLGVFCYLEKWPTFTCTCWKPLNFQMGSHLKKNVGWHHCCWEHLLLISWDCSKLEVKWHLPYTRLSIILVLKNNDRPPQGTEKAHTEEKMYIYIYVHVHIHIYIYYIFNAMESAAPPQKKKLPITHFAGDKFSVFSALLNQWVDSLIFLCPPSLSWTISLSIPQALAWV